MRTAWGRHLAKGWLKGMKSDIEIAQEATPIPIMDVAAGVGLDTEDVDLYGKYKAKIHLDVFDRLKDQPDG